MKSPENISLVDKMSKRRDSGCVIIIKENKLLVIKRHCEDHDIVDYYVLPGGGIEEGETPEQTAIREAKEELSINVKLDKLLFEFNNSGNIEHYFLVTTYSGKVTPSSEVTTLDPTDTYEPIWQDLNTLIEINLLPEKAKLLIIDYAKAQGIIKG